MQTSAVSHQGQTITLVDLLNDPRTPGYCMQDVCISFWKEDGSSDMMLKVKDALTLPEVLHPDKICGDTGHRHM